MRIFRYLKNSKIAVFLIVCLLMVQASTDLALPNYTSQIVDVGIQQSGVEDVATSEMSAATYDQIVSKLSTADQQTFTQAYEQTPEGSYKLTPQGYEERDEISVLITQPLLEIYGLGSTDSDDTSLSDQKALEAAKAEYESLGYDLSAMQMEYLVRVGLTMLGLAALGMVAAMGVGFLAARTAAGVGATLRSKLFSQVVRFSDAEVHSFSAASLITRGTNDIQQIQTVTVMLLRMVLYAPILAIGGIVMISRTNLSMSWIIAVAILVIFAVIAFLVKVAMPKFKIMQTLIDRVNLVSREMLTGLPVIRAFDRREYEEKRFDEASSSLKDTQLFTNRVMAFMMPLMMLIMNIVSVAIVWVGSGFVDEGTLQTGDLIAFITYSMVIIMGFLMMGMISVMLPRADVAAQRVNEVLETLPTISDPAEGGQDCMRKGESEALDDGVSIAFNDVSFKYGDSQKCVLSNITFTAQSGKTTAIIGSTGSGKSTILKLIERFYDVSSGSITLDGVDVRNMSQCVLREQLGYVPQKAFLFSGTIQSNVVYGDENLSPSRVERALEIAQASDFIASKEKGLLTEVAQGGTNVSGGQRQRLAIARALATKARAYLFDDSFSALDYKTDALLRKELSQQLSEKTVIIVAQRIATVLGADHIIVLEEGRIVGQGTHGTLMESCEEYREIALSQLSEVEMCGGGAS